MSNKPSAKAIAKLNATTLFPEIRKEIEKNPSLFAIRGFFIFNITKRGVPMTEWYLLFQGFSAPAIVSQKRPEIPKAKKDEQPIPVAIIQVEDSDLLNFMSGGLTGSRGIVSGKIKIAGAMELAEELEQIFRKAKGSEKTLAYLEHKRGKSERAKARLSSTSTPSPAGGTKVQSLARRFSAMAKQATENTYVPQNNISKLPQAGGVKPTGVTSKVMPTASNVTTAAAAPVSESKTPSEASETIQEQKNQNESEEELSDKVNDIDLAHHEEIAHEAEVEAETEAPVQSEPVFEEPVQEEPIHEDAVQEEPVQEEPVQEEPVQEEPAQEESVQEPVHEESAKELEQEQDVPAAEKTTEHTEVVETTPEDA
ncbi:hypothetical protein BGZ46_009516 [Entomortierella lignicola]|nr:hypothetical protein BGZ46_009516 [Entomortierella lignicola]